MSAHLAIIAAAGLAALSTVRSRSRGSRSAPLALDSKIFERFSKVSDGSTGALREMEDRASFLDDFEHNLSVTEQVWPAMKPRYKSTKLEINRRSDINAWYLGNLLRFTSHPNTPGFVSHQSIHMLDDEGLFASQDPRSSSFALANKAREVGQASLDAYMDARTAEQLARFPQSVRTLLASGEASYGEAHPLLAAEFGYNGDPQKIGLILRRSSGPFGGLFRDALDKELDNPKLVDALIQLSSMSPIFQPSSVKTERDKERHFSRYVLSEMRRKLSDYTLDRKELFARLMDQILREEALRKGRPIRRLERTRPDDIPLELLPELEDAAWAVARQRKWDRS